MSSWFGSNNSGGGHNTHKKGGGEHGHVHRPVILAPNGMIHPILGYETHNTEQYVARTEKVVNYRRFPGMADETEYGTGELYGRTNVFSPKSHVVDRPINDSPWNSGFRFSSPPRKDHRRTTHGKSDNLDSDTDYTDDDDDYYDHRARVNNTKGTRSKNMKDQEYYNNDEKNRRYLKDQEDYYERVDPKKNVYSPPTYTVPISTHQDKEKGNDYAVRSRMTPFGTPPRNETSNETSNFKLIVNSPPQFNPQPKKELGNYHQETIDSTEARRRHGMGGTGIGLGLNAKDKHSGVTIDSKEAARRYNGVLLTDR